MKHVINSCVADAQRRYNSRLGKYLRESKYLECCHDRDVIDLAFGDPHEIISADIVQVLQDALVPRTPSWFAYMREHPDSQDYVARTLSEELGLSVTASDVSFTNGGFAGIISCLRTICGPGSEVVYLNPAWFYYDVMIASLGAIPRPVEAKPMSWRLNVEGIVSALSSSTSAVIVNTPNNPTGVVYTREELEELADALESASSRYGHAIYLISDEAYRKIVFDKRNLLLSPTILTRFSSTLLPNLF